MARDPSGVSRRYFRTLFDAGVTTGLTDGQLLERFATRRGEAAELAFATLVERHGPMVLRACRGIIREDHEAMDAFQATFLVLARRGGSLWVRDSLGPWLHRVACRAATRARAGAARRRALELRLAEREGGRTHDIDRDDLAAVLHEELDRLPDRYRVPIVLCDLEGRTCEEAARHLGCPIGTIGSRLVRGRERLRDRLRRRGLSPNAGGLATSLRPVGPDALMMIPPALVDSTTAAVIRCVAARAVTGGSAALLAQGVLSSMTIIRAMKFASAVLALGVTASGVTLLAQKGTSGDEPGFQGDTKAAQRDDVPVSVVKPGELTVSVVERGSLESSDNADVVCEVEGRTAIISILPEGTRVKKGDLVCTLDSSTLKDNLINRTITAQQAEASYKNASLIRQVAEIAVNEYREGIYKQGLQTAVGEVALAQSELMLAENRLDRTRRAHKRMQNMLAQRGAEAPAGLVTELDMDDRLEATQLELQRQRFSLEQAQAKLKVLKEYTYSKTIKALESEVHIAHSSELSKQAAWELEKAWIAKLERQIKNSKLYAPSEGLVFYANDPNGTGWPQIENGATVRERQLIFRVPDLTRIRVKARVQESIVDQISPGLRAKIKVDAFPEAELNGVVNAVAPRPDPAAFVGSGTKVYTTLVEIEKVPPGLRPGMTAEVEILVTELDSVISVPIRAVLPFNDKDHVAVKKPGGGFEWREVTLGVSNAKIVEVRQGLESGESVALNPLALMSEEEKREKKAGMRTKRAARSRIQKYSGKGRGPAEESRAPR